MIHAYILCLCEEAAVIAKKSRGLCLKCHLMCVSTEFYGTLLLLFPTVSSGTGWGRACMEGRGYLPAPEVLLKQCWSYRLLILV